MERPVEVVMKQFSTTGERLSPKLRADLLALGSRAVPSLLTYLRDKSLWLETAPGEGWPPLHAVELLVELQATEAVQPMLDALCETSVQELLHERLLDQLPKLGATVLEPALAKFTPDASKDVREALCRVLSSLGVRDPRIFAELKKLFADAPISATLCFVDYGAPEALPLLLKAIDDFVPDLDGFFWHLNFNEYVDAYRCLGGTLPPATQQRVEDLRQLWRSRQFKFREPVAAVPKVGRNDPCPCGSGLKYKRCCLGSSPAST